MPTTLATRIAETANFGEGITPVSPLYGQNPDAYSNSTSNLANSPLESLETIVSTGLGILTVVASIFFVIYFFLAAFKWLTAGGDAGKVQKARDEMVQGVLGLIVMVAAYGVIGLISTILGLRILSPGETVLNILNPVFSQ